MHGTDQHLVIGGFHTALFYSVMQLLRASDHDGARPREPRAIASDMHMQQCARGSRICTSLREPLMWNAAGITFALGMALILWEWMIARKKKDGVTFTDRQRMFGMFRITIALAVLVGWIAWMSE